MQKASDRDLSLRILFSAGAVCLNHWTRSNYDGETENLGSSRPSAEVYTQPFRRKRVEQLDSVKDIAEKQRI